MRNCKNYQIESEYKKLNIENREDLNNQIKSIFSIYLKNEERTLNLYKDFLCVELVKYKKIQSTKNYLLFFETIMNQYKNSSIFEDTQFLNMMESLIKVDEESSNNYISISMNQPTIDNSKSKYDNLYNLMNLIDELLEKCLYRNLRLLYGFLSYKINQVPPKDLFDLDFGGLISSITKIHGDYLLKDKVYCIPINQWRNICEHKNYKFIDSENIEVKYGSKKQYSKVVKYNDILPILQNFNAFNTALKLIFGLIFLDIIPDINNKLSGTNIRLEESFAPLFLNLRTVDFSIIEYHYKQENNEFELLFEDLDTIEPTQSRIIHISQIFSRVATSIYDDKILNIKPDTIKICLFHKQKNIANTTIRYEVALDFALKKIKMEELINNINFQIISDIK